MQPIILDKLVCSRRPQVSRSCLWILLIGVCALIYLAPQIALGQAQIAEAESSFDGGPDKVPNNSNPPIPSLRTTIPSKITQVLEPTRPVPHTRQLHVQSSQNVRNRRDGNMHKKLPEGTLTAAR
jgi:hypothetical protein